MVSGKSLAVQLVSVAVISLVIGYFTGVRQTKHVVVEHHWSYAPRIEDVAQALNRNIYYVNDFKVESTKVAYMIGVEFQSEDYYHNRWVLDTASLGRLVNVKGYFSLSNDSMFYEKDSARIKLCGKLLSEAEKVCPISIK